MNKVIKAQLYLIIFLLPLLFFPLTSDYFDFPKNLFLVSAVIITFLTWLLKMIFEKKVSFKRSFFDLPILLLVAASVASTLLAPINKFEAFLFPTGPSTLIALGFLYFLITNHLEKQDKKMVMHSLIASAIVLALLSLASGLGLFAQANFFPLLKEKTFTPAGNYFGLTVFLAISLVWLALITYRELTKPSGNALVGLIHALFLFIIGAGLVNAGYTLFNVIKPVFLPVFAGWSIAIDTLKNFPLFGVGAQNFSLAFYQYRPLSYNATALWNVAFDSSSNYFFQTWTIFGTIGLAALLFLSYKIISQFKLLKNSFEPESNLLIILLLFLGIFALLPINFLILFVFFIFLSLLAIFLPQSEYSETSKILPWTFMVIALVLSGACFYLVYRSLGADMEFKKSLDAYVKNDGAATYNAQVKAIGLNPYRPTYRLAYAQTNLALAQSMSTKKDLTDQDRQNVSVLIQQAIQEAKSAVTLDPQNARDWENLAAIYRNLINFAEGADQWTIAAYQQTIALDPVNPFTRITLGGVYYAQKNWDQAIASFSEAVYLKNDNANAHYNLAAALREKGDFTKAAAEMQTVLNLVDRSSEDWTKANSELEAIQNKLKEKAQTENPTKGESLKKPEPLPSGIKPPLELPTGSAPEVQPQATPTP
jgi:tetratricopeptide (TPR) repeat protein